MSYLANFVLSIAVAIASALGSKYEIRTENNEISVRFTRPDNREGRLWKDYYSNGAIYVRDMCEPVFLEQKVEEQDVEIKSANYLKTWMQMNAIERAFTAKGEKNNEIKTLLYITIAGIVGVAFLIMVI